MLWHIPFQNTKCTNLCLSLPTPAPIFEIVASPWSKKMIHFNLHSITPHKIVNMSSPNPKGEVFHIHLKKQMIYFKSLGNTYLLDKKNGRQSAPSTLFVGQTQDQSRKWAKWWAIAVVWKPCCNKWLPIQIVVYHMCCRFKGINSSRSRVHCSCTYMVASNHTRYTLPSSYCLNSNIRRWLV